MVRDAAERERSNVDEDVLEKMARTMALHLESAGEHVPMLVPRVGLANVLCVVEQRLAALREPEPRKGGLRVWIDSDELDDLQEGIYALAYPSRERAEVFAEGSPVLEFVCVDPELEPERARVPLIEVRQADFIPGFAAFAAGSVTDGGPAKVVLNVGDLVALVHTGAVPAAELPYIVADSIMHEVVHVLEEWAGVEFSEERVDALIQRYTDAARSGALGTPPQDPEPTP